MKFKRYLIQYRKNDIFPWHVVNSADTLDEAYQNKRQFLMHDDMRNNQCIIWDSKENKKL
jgi:putative ribosome biogenesis GTPase RsgA